MKRALIIASIGLMAADLSGCATYKKADYEWIGGPRGGNVVYSVHQLAPYRYYLEANTVQSVSNNQLIAAYKVRGAKLCSPREPSYQYKLSLEHYMDGFSTSAKLRMTAPKITGIVTCKGLS